MTKVYVVESFYGDGWDGYTAAQQVFADLETAIEWSEEQFDVETETKREGFRADGIAAVVTEKEVERGACWTTFTVFEMELIGG